MKTVPILPDYLAQLEKAVSIPEPNDLQDSLKYRSLYLHYVSSIIDGTADPMIQNTDDYSNISRTLNTLNELNATNSAEYNLISNKMLSAIQLNEENGSVGILLAVKALVQLIATPFVTKCINRLGYRIPTIGGTFCLFLTSLGMVIFTYTLAT